MDVHGENPLLPYRARHRVYRAFYSSLPMQALQEKHMLHLSQPCHAHLHLHRGKMSGPSLDVRNEAFIVTKLSCWTFLPSTWMRTTSWEGPSLDVGSSCTVSDKAANQCACFGTCQRQRGHMIKYSHSRGYIDVKYNTRYDRSQWIKT